MLFVCQMKLTEDPFLFLRLGGWLSLAADDSTNSLWLYCSLGASHLLITGNR